MQHEFLNHLKEDHVKQKELSKKLIGATDPKMREELRQQFHDELLPHILGEEASIFPFLVECKDPKAHEHALVSLEEHAVAKNALKDFMKCSPGDDTFKAKIKVLDELNKHHIEEEEKDDFGALTKQCDKACLDKLYEQYEKAEEKAKGRK